jgi:hypothetical protein
MDRHYRAWLDIVTQWPNSATAISRMAANRNIQTPDSPGLGIPWTQYSFKNYTLYQADLKPKIMAQTCSTLHMNHKTVFSYTSQSLMLLQLATVSCQWTLFNKNHSKNLKRESLIISPGIRKYKLSYARWVSWSTVFLPALEHETPSCVLSLGLRMSVHVRMQYFCRVQVSWGERGEGETVHI